jgi:predicted metal-dependent hydrolase
MKARDKQPRDPLAWQDADDMRWAARHWATRIGVKAPIIQVRSMRRKWASISTAGRMTLNTDLLEQPRELGEFVIVHELVHLLVPNHGKVFKLFMGAYLPDWQAREKDLRARERRALLVGQRKLKQH